MARETDDTLGDDDISGTIESEGINVGDVIASGNGSGGERQDDSGTIKPGDIINGTADSDSGTGSGRRGRPRGSRNFGKRNTSRKETSEDLTALLVSIHWGLSKVLNVQELELNPEEAAMLAKPLARINELYGGFVIPEKVMAITNMAVAMGGVYAPRIAAYTLRKQNEAAKTKGKVVEGQFSRP